MYEVHILPVMYSIYIYIYILYKHTLTHSKDANVNRMKYMKYIYYTSHRSQCSSHPLTQPGGHCMLGVIVIL